MLPPAAFAWLVVVIAACSGGTRNQPASGGATPTGGSGAGARPAGVSPPASPSAAECTSLFAHAVEIRVAEQRQTVPAGQLPTEAEQAELRAQLETESGAACRAGSRATYTCGMAATTLAALAACR